MGNKKRLNGTTTTNNGQFLLSIYDTGNYSILIESIGYVPFNIDKSMGKNIDLKNIALLKS